MKKQSKIQISPISWAFSKSTPFPKEYTTSSFKVEKMVVDAPYNTNPIIEEGKRLSQNITGSSNKIFYPVDKNHSTSFDGEAKNTLIRTGGNRINLASNLEDSLRGILVHEARYLSDSEGDEDSILNWSLYEKEIQLEQNIQFSPRLNQLLSSKCKKCKYGTEQADTCSSINSPPEDTGSLFKDSHALFEALAIFSFDEISADNNLFSHYFEDQEDTKQLQKEVFEVIASLKMKIDDLNWLYDSAFLKSYNKISLAKLDLSIVDNFVEEFIQSKELLPVLKQQEAIAQNQLGILIKLKKAQLTGDQIVRDISECQDRESSERLVATVISLSVKQRAELAGQLTNSLCELSFKRFSNNIVIELLKDPTEAKSEFLKKACVQIPEFLDNANANRVFQRLIIEGGGNLAAPFIDFANSNFLQYKNHLNFSKNVLSLIEQYSCELFPALKQHILKSPKELLGKNYINKSFIIILTKLNDTELESFYKRVGQYTKELISCKYGNFLIQEVLTRGFPEARKKIEKEVLKGLKHFLGLKYTKYVICPMLGNGTKSRFTQLVAKEFLKLDKEE